MKRLFGSSKKQQVQGPKDSIIQMRSTLEMLEKKETHLETKIAAEVALARQHAVTNKSRMQALIHSLILMHLSLFVIIVALMALKRKKMYEGQREHTRGARFNLETQILTIENANINLETLNAMKVGSSTMKNIHGEMNIDKVDDTMDDIREQMDLANEISSAISNPLGLDTGIDEDELAAELEQLEQAELDATLLDVKNVSGVEVAAGASSSYARIPQAQVKSPGLGGAGGVTMSKGSKSQAELEEERELEELRASMAL